MASNPAAGDQKSSSTSAVGALLSRISQTINSGLSDRRPWSELADRSGFAKPESFSDANHRIRKNYSYFRTNYLMIVTTVLAISLLTNPLSLLLLSALLAAWLFLYIFRQASDPPIAIFGRQFSDRAVLFALIVCTVVVLFLTSVGYVLVSALMVGLAVVLVHGAFRVPEDLFLDEAEPIARVPSLLSFLAGGAPAPQPPIASRA
ncbi:PRA1 family protein B4-like [Salvia divinorum]|uniref:PRA1 family protein n=1 Tax=Salvia divinorum TaxID=28513 RepID=A0ABD1GYN3_SALDI